MSSRLDACVDALRYLARSSEPEAVKRIAAERQIFNFVASELRELDAAVIRERESDPQHVTFWQLVRDIITQRLAQLEPNG